MSELRFDPIKQHWVILAGKRARRPSEFRVVIETREKTKCPFCPGHEAETTETILVLPEGATTNWEARLILNKFPAVSDVEEELVQPTFLHEVREGWGRHEVMIESSDHQDRQARYSTSHLSSLYRIYQSRIGVFIDEYNCQHVTVFTNVGYRGGATLAHPHSQIIGLMQVPMVIIKEKESAEQHYREHQNCLFCEMIKSEIESGERVLYQTNDYIAICPYASRFAYEFAVYPLRHSADFREVRESEIDSLGSFMKACLQAMDAILDEPDYNVIFHTVPAENDGEFPTEMTFHWHVEVIPRVSTQAGMEWGTGIHINSYPPEIVAAVYSKEIAEHISI